MLRISVHRELLSVLLAKHDQIYFLLGRELELPYQGFHANVCDDA